MPKRRVDQVKKVVFEKNAFEFAVFVKHVITAIAEVHIHSILLNTFADCVPFNLPVNFNFL